MHITQITLNFTETCNLGDYSNTKPAIELTASLDAGDDVHAVIDDLASTAKKVIYEKIDDELEKVGKPPKYWEGQKWDVIYSHTTQLVAIVPAATIFQLDGGFYHYLEGVRYPAAQKAAQIKLGHIGNTEKAAFFDCSITTSIDALRAYATEQDQLYKQKQQERREAEERQQRDEWAARHRQAHEDEDGDDDESFYEEEDDDE